MDGPRDGRTTSLANYRGSDGDKRGRLAGMDVLLRIGEQFTPFKRAVAASLAGH
jgi:hypothetical protein